MFSKQWRSVCQTADVQLYRGESRTVAGVQYKRYKSNPLKIPFPNIRDFWELLVRTVHDHVDFSNIETTANGLNIDDAYDALVRSLHWAENRGP